MTKGVAEDAFAVSDASHSKASTWGGWRRSAVGASIAGRHQDPDAGGRHRRHLHEGAGAYLGLGPLLRHRNGIELDLISRNRSGQAAGIGTRWRIGERLVGVGRSLATGWVG